MEVKIKKLNENAKITHGSEKSAGYDLHACMDSESIFIEPQTNKLVGTGISMAIPEGYFGGIYARSGLATKEGLRPANCVGVVDSDYRGEIKVALFNDTNEKKVVVNGDRIAQLIIQPYLDLEFVEVDELDDSNRGENGFGSTGK